jgi:endonuclease/exonuclease/phosphatase family metal-dependent hydrolase
MARRLRHLVYLGMIVLFAVGSGGLFAPTRASADAERSSPVRVMTRNLYFGADLAPIFAASTVQEVVAAATQRFTIVQQTDFPSRAQVIAKEIKVRRPDLVGLQEVALWRRGEPGVLDGPGTPATIVVYDFLQILQDALDEQGVAYRVLVQQVTTDGEVPTTLGFDIRLTQRNVILGRVPNREQKTPGHGEQAPDGRGVGPDDLTISNPASGLYATVLSVPTPLGPVVDTRGWVSVDVTADGRTFRVISTHLDSSVAAIRRAQAGELLAGPAQTSMPVILVGDLNSAPGEVGPSAYATLVGAGFVDTWTQVNGTAPGLTCCHAENLRNPTPTFTKRIDHVLSRPRLKVLQAQLIGGDHQDRTRSGLWASDHAGIMTTFMP